MLQPPRLKPRPIGEREEKGLFERAWFRALLLVAVLGLLTAATLVIDLKPNLSHLNVAMLSGSQRGNYYALVDRMQRQARGRKGNVRNISSQGSLDNLKQLRSAKDQCGIRFGLVQGGLIPAGERKLKLIARLPARETVFLIGRNADGIQLFGDLRGKRIGIGPQGSGSARLARQLFGSPQLRGLGVRLTTHPLPRQMKLLRNGSLDLGFVVMANRSQLIGDMVRKHGLQIVGLRHAAALSESIPFLRRGLLPAGYFDPVRILPTKDKRVLQVETLVLGNGCARRSEVIALLQLLSLTFPTLLNHNLQSPNTTGLPLSKHASVFFQNRGPELLDQYAPWLADWVPLGSLVQLVMVVSILFNVMGAAHRFRLWRIDASRVTLENDLDQFFGPEVLVSEVARLQAEDQYREPERLAALDALITRMRALRRRCRKHSVSMLVPMGQEMSYRYQESLLQERLDALIIFRGKLV